MKKKRLRRLFQNNQYTLKKLEDTTDIEVTGRRIRIKGIVDYAIPIISAFAFAFLIAFELYIWSLIPVLFFVFSILYHNDTFFDFETNTIYYGHYLGKFLVSRKGTIQFNAVIKIKVIGSLRDKSGDGNMYKPYIYEYFLELTGKTVKLPLSIESLTTATRINNTINKMGYRFNFEIDESQIAEIRRLWGD
jgi:hypothetical protein